MIELTDEDILARITSIEDATVERKLHNDKKKDWVKSVVAFSNSLANGQPGVLFVGVRDDGRIEDGQFQKTNFADFQKTLSEVFSNIYPPVAPTMLVREKDGPKFLAVIVYGSPNRPHFAGKSYRRDGTQSVDASEEHIKEFVARRSSKFTELLNFKEANEPVTLSLLLADADRRRGQGTYAVQSESRIIHCNQFYITLTFNHNGPRKRSFPLGSVEIGYDNTKDRPELIVTSG